MPNLPENIMSRAVDLGRGYVDWSGCAAPTASTSASVANAMTAGHLHIGSPTNWESLCQAATSTTLSPVEILDGQRRIELGDVSIRGTYHNDVIDQRCFRGRALDRLSRNLSLQIDGTIDKPSEYLFDIIEDIYIRDDDKTIEPKGQPIPEDKLLEVLMSE